MELNLHKTRLYELGNQSCPICDRQFNTPILKHSNHATIEHVPSKSLAQEAGSRAIRMCMTCSKCNNTTSRFETWGKAVNSAEEVRLSSDMKEYLRGRAEVIDETDVVKWREDKTSVLILRNNLDDKVLAIELDNNKSRSGRVLNRITDTLDLRLEFPQHRHRWSELKCGMIKAGLLSLFSLVGSSGYKYMRGCAVDVLRKQILEPKAKWLDKVAWTRNDDWRYGDGLFITDYGRKCWTAVFGSWVILLPVRDDLGFYSWIEGIDTGKDELTGRLISRWNHSAFGAVRSRNIDIERTNSLNPGSEHTDRRDWFGEFVRIKDREAGFVTYVVVDHGQSDLTLVPIKRDK